MFHMIIHKINFLKQQPHETFILVCTKNIELLNPLTYTTSNFLLHIQLTQMGVVSYHIKSNLILHYSKYFPS